LLLNLLAPRINDYMTTAVVDAVHAREGEALASGAKVMDLLVDLSAVAAHDCPPVSLYRLVLRDRAWLRRLDVAVGDEVGVGAPLALFATEPDEALAAPPARAARVAIAGIIRQSAWS
jgi:hypothetical protein